jgi:hypothetical protein
LKAVTLSVNLLITPKMVENQGKLTTDGVPPSTDEQSLRSMQSMSVKTSRSQLDHDEKLETAF